MQYRFAVTFATLSTCLHSSPGVCVASTWKVNWSAPASCIGSTHWINRGLCTQKIKDTRSKIREILTLKGIVRGFVSRSQTKLKNIDTTQHQSCFLIGSLVSRKLKRSATLFGPMFNLFTLSS